MSILQAPPRVVPPPLHAILRSFTVAEYQNMVRAGILTEDDRVELLEGWIVVKMAHNPPHDGTLQAVNKALSRVLLVGYDIRVQMAIETADSEPEPDLTVVRGDEWTYHTRHPVPSDIALLVEVASSTLATDRDVKGRLYARAGIEIYWIINLVDTQVEVYTDPTGPVAIPTYRTRRDFRPGDSIPLSYHGQPGGSVAVASFLR